MGFEVKFSYGFEFDFCLIGCTYLNLNSLPGLHLGTLAVIILTNGDFYGIFGT